MATRWGIVSSGKICHDFVTAVTSTLPESEHRVVAVAARSEEKAREFAEAHGIPKFYQGYERLADDPEVDVVYVGTIGPAHLAVAKLMLESGKPVVVEKPLAMNVRETTELIALARSKSVFLMEAIWSRFQPTYRRLKEELDKKSIGDVVFVNVFFGVRTEVPRISLMELGGGTVLDLGIYCIQLINLVFNKEKPEKIAARGHLNAQGTDDNANAIFCYSGGRTATFSSHSRVELRCEATIYGTEGHITLEVPFWSAHKLTTPTGTLEFPLPTPKDGKEKKYNFLNSPGLAYEAQHVRECLRKGLKESPLLDLDESLQIAGFMEEVRKQVGVIYPQD